jgi:very-short-patch-repair endonuclease
MRKEMSLPEVLLWEHLRGGKLEGFRFRRQHPVGPFILDFYCPDWKLAIEVDGAAHDSPQRAEQDDRRTMWLNNQGINVMRFAARSILAREELEGVLLTIRNALPPPPAVPAPPPPRGGGDAPSTPEIET